MREFIASDEFADFWVRVNTRAQQALQRILTGDGSGAVSLQGDQVVLDVDEVINRVKDRLVARGLTIVENVPIPETDRQIVLMDAPQLRQMRTIYAFGNPVARWLLPLVGVLYLATFLLARRRPRMARVDRRPRGRQRPAARLGPVHRPAAVRQPARRHAFGPASRVFYETLLSYLERGQEVVLWLGVILVVAGLFAGANRYGTAVRSTMAGGLEKIGTSIGGSGLDARRPLGGGERGMAPGGRHRARQRRTAVGQQRHPDRLWWSLALVLVLLAVLQVLVGAGRRGSWQVREHPGGGGRPPRHHRPDGRCHARRTTARARGQLLQRR